MKHRDDNPIVYSTETGDRRKAQAPKPKAAPAKPGAKQSVTVMRSRKGRGGKTVTLVSGLSHCPEAFDNLAKKLKQRCGTGGTVKDSEIVIQGDHRDKVAEALRSEGYTVKLAGG